MVLAGLAAEGETFIKNVHFIDRGYDDLEGRIGSLGGEIERLDETTWENTYAHRIKSGN